MNPVKFYCFIIWVRLTCYHVSCWLFSITILSRDTPRDFEYVRQKPPKVYCLQIWSIDLARIVICIFIEFKFEKIVSTHLDPPRPLLHIPFGFYMHI